VLEADNIATAKSYASTPKLNLVVTDLALPGENGATFLKWLRQQPREPGWPDSCRRRECLFRGLPTIRGPRLGGVLPKTGGHESVLGTVATILKAPRDPEMSS